MPGRGNTIKHNGVHMDHPLSVLCPSHREAALLANNPGSFKRCFCRLPCHASSSSCSVQSPFLGSLLDHTAFAFLLPSKYTCVPLEKLHVPDPACLYADPSIDTFQCVGSYCPSSASTTPGPAPASLSLPTAGTAADKGKGAKGKGGSS